MIYFSIFILTLILSHIARAMPACDDVDDVAPPEELYDPTYNDDQQILPIILYNVTYSTKYDNKYGDTNKTACNTGPHGLAHRFPHFKNFPHFPKIGGAWNVKWGSQYCGSCWNLTNVKNRKTISIIAMDKAKSGYNISHEAFKILHGGGWGHVLKAEAKLVAPYWCGYRHK